ncbi:hypothetical protein [Glycomyces niveus]|uniref:Uncharacterized protein n=1 Tax=Glycomyces niveus TaxID=2820287 RepID=A0ABS3U2N3_9ACTN|nr:hypothetical protein [Glycomyces sp. NEAU-S30]MBO3732995.1 hypothetical protein [Glycomyces sp. NEAU-S30]
MVKRGPVDRDDERASAGSRGNGNSRSETHGEDHARSSQTDLLRLQRRMGNRAVGQLIQGNQPSLQRSAGPPVSVQRELPSHVGIFSMDLVKGKHNALVGRINTEVVPKIGRCGDLAVALKQFGDTAGIDAEVVKQASTRIRHESDKPGTQAIEKATETYLKAYEALEVAPVPEVETRAVDEATAALYGKVDAAAKVRVQDWQSKAKGAVDAEKKRIETYAKDIGTGVDLTLKSLKVFVTGKDAADVGIEFAKEASTKLAEWILSKQPRIKNMEETLEKTNRLLLEIQTLEAEQEIKAAEHALTKATLALNEKMREIGRTVKELERAERDLTIDMRALGLEGAAQAVETRAAARRTANEMLIALDECQLAIEALLPEAIDVHQTFAAIAATSRGPGSTTPLSPEQEGELASFIKHGSGSKTYLEDNLNLLERYRPFIESGHYDKIYKPIQETLHQTQI